VSADTINAGTGVHGKQLQTNVEWSKGKFLPNNECV